MNPPTTAAGIDVAAGAAHDRPSRRAPRRRRAAALAAALLALYGARAHAQSLLVVAPDPGPGVDFTQVATAVGAAVDGDVILVRDGSYSGFTIVDKALVIVGEDQPRVSSITVRDLAPARSVAIDGFRVTSGVDLEDDAGPVWLEDLDVQSIGGLFGFPGAALEVVDCAAVSLTRCVLTGAPGLEATGSQVYAYDSGLVGSDGVSAGFVLGVPGFELCTASAGSPGYAGASLASGFLFLGRSMVVGGQGGFGGECPAVPPFTCTGCPSCIAGESGGHGLVAGAAASLARLDTTFLGGDGGTSPCGNGGPGSGLVNAGADLPLAGTGVSFEATSVGQVGDVLSLRFEGAPGDFVWLQVAAAQSPLFFPPWSGAWLVQPSAPVFFMGAIPAGGTLERNPVLSPLGTPFLVLYAQGIFVDFPGGVTTRQISSPSLLVLYE